MRVLMISARSDHGGGPRHIELLLKHLPQHMETHVACPDDHPYGQRLRSLTNGRAYTLPHRRFKLNEAIKLARYAKAHRIDVVHTHGKGAGVYGRLVSSLTGIPCVHTPHGVHIGSYGPVALRLYKWYENLTSRWVDHLVYVSSDERSVAVDQGLWTATPSSVIANGVQTYASDARASLRRETRRLLGVAEGRMLVATLSRFDYQKNMNEAFLLAKRHPELTFVWVGEGDDRSKLIECSRAEGVDHILFPGSVDDPSTILAASDVYLSTSRWEGMPLAVLEAMSMRLPMVVTDVPGHRELVAGADCGLLYHLGDIDMASASLMRLAVDGTMRAELGKKGAEVQARLYSCDAQAKAIAALYSDLLRCEEER